MKMLLCRVQLLLTGRRAGCATVNADALSRQPLSTIAGAPEAETAKGVTDVPRACQDFLDK